MPLVSVTQVVEKQTFLDVVVRKSAAILQLLAGEDEALLIRRNSCTSCPLAFMINILYRAT